MAKTKQALASAQQGEVAEVELSKRVLNAIDAIKRPFEAYISGFQALELKRRDLAPKFIKTFGLWQSETGKGFVDFVRYLHPDIGGRDTYRNHPVYQAADYLRRLANQQARRADAANAAANGEQETEPAPVPATDALTRMVATVMSFIKDEAKQDRFFELMATELHWDEKRIQRMREAVTNVDPIAEIRARNLENIQIRAAVHTHQEETVAA
jgi:hypothetical protein